MTASERLTEADIHRAAWETLLAGENPTGEELRRRLGRGSKTTFYTHLRTFWPLVGQAFRTQREIPDLPADVATAAQLLWSKAVGAATEHAARQYAERLAATEKDRRDAALAVEQARQDAADAAQAAVAAQAQAREAQEARGAALRDLEAFRGQLALRERELANTNRDLEESQRMVLRLQESLASLKEAHGAETDRLVQQHTAERDRLMVETDRVRQQMTRMAEANETRERAAEQEVKQLRAAQVENTRQNATLTTQLQAEKTKVADLQKRLEKATSSPATPKSRRAAKRGTT